MHVDLIRNDWAAGFQVAVARVTAPEGKAHVEQLEAGGWEGIVDTALKRQNDVATTELDTLEALSGAVRGDYVWATEAHEAHECPFDPDRRLPFRSGSDVSALPHL